MSRPRKCRRVCAIPWTRTFVPGNQADGAEEIILTVDEYESLRLIDREGLSQEQCGELMQVSRATVQQIYASARKKLADMLVEGLPLRIQGGEYQLCDGDNPSCTCGNCYKLNPYYTETKGEQRVRIAVTYENGQIFQHFGRTQQFKVYEVEKGQIRSAEVVGTNGSGHGALAGILGSLKVEVLICGGIGGGAQNALKEAGIKFYGGASGDADEAVEALLAGELAFDPAVHCDHHDHEEGGEAHDCGDHGCGNCGEHGCH